ncbi:MAG: hypothetical protein PQJ50_13400 [Spirochaetales bacterium]|nr:hypothetical protein [Spirochaetales bacterium]
MKKLIFLILPILLFSACTGDAIFKTLENEEKIEDNNNFKDGTPTVKFAGYGSPNEYYLVHGKNVWVTMAGGSYDWSKKALPSGYGSEATVPSMALYDNSVYVSVIDHDKNYRSGILKANSATGTFTELFYDTKDSSDYDDFQFYRYTLHPVNDGNGLYIAKETRSWSDTTSSGAVLQETELYYYENTNFENGLDAANLIDTGSYSRFVVQGAVSVGGVNYVILNNIAVTDTYNAGVLLTSGTPTVIGSYTDETPDVDATFNQIYHATIDDGELILISLRQSGRYHNILYKLGAGDWEEIGYDSSDVQFSAFYSLNGLGDGTYDNYIMVGTRADTYSSSNSYYYGDGYYLMNFDNGSSPTITSNVDSIATNYSSTDLRDATINDIYYDSNSDRLYITTSAEGLWLNTPDDDGDRKWSRE